MAAQVGADPDPGFPLSNERTFLAWVRTAVVRRRAHGDERRHPPAHRCATP
ncbi:MULTISPECIES: DUF202 domain-containing protein [Rhodococcus]|uniref:DUF202 domain-containing protein n=1 Tax=Rhodococcus TaxID=1827 RepID=UPI000DD2E500|nr:DUF202 domain-containing protein [Rhodococcus opacus]